MKKKIFSIALAVMMCFSLTVSVAAYNGVADIEVIDDYELITPSNIPLSCALFGHSWATNPHFTASYRVNSSAHCAGFYTKYLDTYRCTRACNTYKTVERDDEKDGKHIWIQNLCRSCGAIR